MSGDTADQRHRFTDQQLAAAKDKLLPLAERAELEALYGKVIGPIIDAKLEAKAQELVALHAESVRQVLDHALADTIDRDTLLASRDEAAKLLGVSLSTIKRMEESGELPEPIKFGERTVRHRLIDIEAIAKSKKRVWSD